MIPLLEKMFPSLAKKVALAVVAVILLSGGTFLYFAHRTGYMILEGQAQLKAQGIAHELGSLDSPKINVRRRGDATEGGKR